MPETIFTMEATPVKYGAGAVDDAGWEVARLGVRRALLVTDPGVAAAGHSERVRASLAAAGVGVVVYDRAHVEPTLASLEEAAAFATDAGVDGFVSVGGGSSIDTAKVADLVVSHPAPVMAFFPYRHGAGRVRLHGPGGPGAPRAGRAAARPRRRRPARALRALMRDVGAPAGLRALGYGEGDVPALVEGALRQQRLLAVAPREPGADDLAAILTASL
jgi:alcohol dehydrogenase class IV